MPDASHQPDVTAAGGWVETHLEARPAGDQLGPLHLDLVLLLSQLVDLNLGVGPPLALLLPALRAGTQ